MYRFAASEAPAATQQPRARGAARLKHAAALPPDRRRLRPYAVPFAFVESPDPEPEEASARAPSPADGAGRQGGAEGLLDPKGEREALGEPLDEGVLCPECGARLPLSVSAALAHAVTAHGADRAVVARALLGGLLAEVEDGAGEECAHIAAPGAPGGARDAESVWSYLLDVDWGASAPSPSLRCPLCSERLCRTSPEGEEEELAVCEKTLKMYHATCLEEATRAAEVSPGRKPRKQKQQQQQQQQQRAAAQRKADAVEAPGAPAAKRHRRRR